MQKTVHMVFGWSLRMTSSKFPDIAASLRFLDILIFFPGKYCNSCLSLSRPTDILKLIQMRQASDAKDTEKDKIEFVSGVAFNT